MVVRRRQIWRLQNTVPIWLLAASSCAHSYFYTPEIAGEGAGVRKGTIAFRLPSTDPRLKMKIVCLGVTDVPRDAGSAKQGKMVQVRMYFLRVKPAVESPQEFIDPSEQRLILPGGAEVRPGLVHAAAQRPDKLIGLTPSKKQIVEMYFPLPEGMRGAKDIQSFGLQWKVHFDVKSAEQQVTRFDRQDSRPQQGAELFPWDSDFPLDYSPMPVPGWSIDPWPWRWWEPYPFWP